MTTNYHTAISVGAAANAATFNTPLGALDEAITNAQSGVYNVLEYGATSGGAAATNTAAIQAAINAAAASGGTVIIPSGTYATNATLSMGSNVILQGQGRQSTTLEPSAETFAAITLTGAITNWQIIDIGINYGTATGDVSATNAAAIGIKIEASGANFPYNGYIRNVQISFPYRGIQDLTTAFMLILDHVYVLSAGNWGIYKKPASGAATTWTMRNCYVNVAAVGGMYIEAVHSLGMIACAVDNCDCTESAIAITSCQGEIAALYLENCTIDDGKACVLLSDSLLVCSGWYLYDCTLTGATQSFLIRVYAGSADMSGCFANDTAYSGAGSYYGIMPDGSSALRLQGCTIETPTGSGGTPVDVYRYGGNISEISSTTFNLYHKFVLSAGNAPASAAATGTYGQIAWDASYIYVCVNTDTWKRAEIATWE